MPPIHLLSTSETETDPQAKVRIGNRVRSLINVGELSNVTEPYVCVSYAWGDEKAFIPNILFGGTNKMSPRVFPILETVRNTIDEDWPVWLDAFCLPPRGHPNRIESLEEMGDIYAKATKVVVVLSEECRDLLKLARLGKKSEKPSEYHFEALEKFDNDSWVSRAWTYQEIANVRGGNAWLFVAEGHPTDTVVSGEDLLNTLGEIKQVYQRIKFPMNSPTADEISPDVMVKLRLKNIDMMEDILADVMIADYLERSALHVITSVSCRQVGREEDYFTAMIGAIASSRNREQFRTTWKNITEEEPMLEFIIQPLKAAFSAERFIEICQTKGDYSFIFTSNPRSKRPHQRWRPLPHVLRPLCVWPGWGAKQPGRIENNRLVLSGMMRMKEGPIGARGIKFFATWAQSRPEGSRDLRQIENLLAFLGDVGFSGTYDLGNVIVLERGYFVPVAPPTGPTLGAFVVISTTIRWVFGAPGILVSGSENSDSQIFLCVGVFVGDVATTGDDYVLSLE